MIVVAPGVAGNPCAGVVVQLMGVRPGGLIQLTDANDGSRRFEQIARIVADRGPPVGEVVHVRGATSLHPLAIARGVLGRFGASHSSQLEAALARQSADLVACQISSPTDRMSSSALLLRTTPGRIT